MIRNFEELLEKAKKKGRKNLIVVSAHDDVAILSSLIAKNLDLVTPIFIGEKKKIEEILYKEGVEPSNFEIIEAKTDEESAKIGVSLIKERKGDLILKGKLQTSTLMKAVLDKETGLKKSALLSDVFIFENKKDNKLVLMSDGGVALYPDITQKIDIINNAVFVAKNLEIENPKVALLAAVEVVNPQMPSTFDAAIISKMNQRGQIKDCIIDGPLALDNAISKEAAQHKGIKSPVAGEADILIVPNIEAGNIFGKALTYYANFRVAHVIIGATAPVLITSRADSKETKLFTIALGIINLS